MPPCERLTANLVLFVLVLYFPTQVLCGIDAIRSQYGLSGLLPQNETIIGEVSQPVADIRSESRNLPVVRHWRGRKVEPQMEDDMDFDLYDDVVGRSLFPAISKSAPKALGSSPFYKPKPVLSPGSVGKCFVEVLTSSLVKPKTKIPLGNGSNPSLSVIETCCKGYEVYVHNPNQCVPVCEKPCINGFCVRPNECECFPDHVRSLNDDCLPTCPIGCLNGRCHSNGTCSCNKGYVLDLYKAFCMPYCSQACGQFANCTVPETCSCIKGYGLNAVSGRCEPLCKYPCGNGQCTMPNVCSCFPGFKLINQTCQANCSRGCENGKCVANEVCACDPGWVMDHSGSKCLPYCQSGCQNGNCAAPGTCSCNKGYHKVNNECKPHCTSGCLNGKCTAPDVCTCNEGYESSFSFFWKRCKKIKRVIVIPEEFGPKPIFNPVIVAVPSHKQPIFQPTIHIGSHSYPQQNILPPQPPIQAPPIYNPSIVVQPTQVKPIFNAPVVAKPSAPNLPTVGQANIYDKQPAYNPFYQPAHPVSSSNGKSNSVPNYLERQPAFNPNFNAGVVNSAKVIATYRPPTPKTTSRTTKRPTTPKVIQKVNVWKYTTPKPHCSKACLNGRCTGKNQCTCNLGYKMASGSQHKCVPYCAKGCLHGTCTAPDSCTCNYGYRKKNNKCVKT